MDSLPPELIDRILLQTRRQNGLASLATLALVCGFLRSSAMELLHRDVVLTNTNMAAYVTTLPNAHQRNTRSLTLRLEPGPKPPNSFFGFGTPASGLVDTEVDEVSGNLQKLASHLDSFTNLQTLSIFMIDRANPMPNFSVKRSDLALVIQNLPPSVTNLEVDTRNFDSIGDSANHFCVALSKVLKQLINVRLRLGTMCSAMLQDVGALETLHTVCINCSFTDQQAEGCNSNLNASLANAPPVTRASDSAQARPSLRESWHRALSSPEKLHLKSSAKVHLVDWKSKPRAENPLDFAAFDMFRRYDAQANSTLIMPVSREWVHLGKLWIRTPEESDLLGARADIEAVAEGSGWRDTVYGSRCFPTGATVAVEDLQPLLVLDRTGWHDKMGRKSYKIWQNEDRVGRHLIRPENRAQSSESRAITWEVPSGWTDKAGAFELVGPGAK